MGYASFSSPPPKIVNYRVISLVVSTSLFMQYLDSTILITALPTMAQDFGVDPIDMNVALLVYQLAMAVFIPVGSAIGNRFGAKPAFLVALLPFIIGSVLCGFSSSLPALVASRALQGLGGAMMIPVGRLIVVRSSAPSELVSALNWLLIPGIIGPMLGPPLGGAIVTYGSWHGIFFINVPVGLLGLVLGYRLIPNIAGDRSTPFDLRGLALATPALAGLVFGLETVAHGDQLIRAAAILSVAGLFGFLYLRHARACEGPLIDISLLRITTFRMSMAIGSVLRYVAAAVGFLIPLWFQLAMHMSAAQSGAITFAMPTAALMSRFLTSWLMRRLSMRTILLVTCLGCSLAALGCAALRPNLPLPVFYLALGVLSVLTTVPMTLISAIAYVDIPKERIGAATGFYSTVQQMVLSLGVTGAVAALSLGQGLTGGRATENAPYSVAFAILAVLGLGALVLVWRLSHDAGETLRQPNVGSARRR
ncbi:MAG: MFS transporter [Sphingobium sp.]